MAIWTLWLSIASGGSVFSTGISKPRASLVPALASTTPNTNNQFRHMVGCPFIIGQTISHSSDETDRPADCTGAHKGPATGTIGRQRGLRGRDRYLRATNSVSISLSVSSSLPPEASITSAVPLGVTHTRLL